MFNPVTQGFLKSKAQPSDPIPKESNPYYLKSSQKSPDSLLEVDLFLRPGWLSSPPEAYVTARPYHCTKITIPGLLNVMLKYCPS